MIILRGIRDHGRKWKILEKTLNGRSENQIKNRYYGTLSFIEKKVKKKLKREKQKTKNKKSMI